jgi:hypothetical protein
MNLDTLADCVTVLLEPSSLISRQCADSGLSFNQISAGALGAMVTTSSRPSPLRSPTPEPR